MRIGGFLILFALAGVLYLLGRNRTSPTQFFSKTSLWGSGMLSWRERLALLPKILFFGGLLALLIAWYDPTHSKTIALSSEQGPPREGVLLFLALDRSGSMKTEVSKGASRMDRMKEIVRQFLAGNQNQTLSGRQNDLVGMLTFARIPKVLAPPTLDIDSLTADLDQITVVSDESDDGTAIGYAIYRAAQWVASTRHYTQELQAKGVKGYQIRDVALIVVTDGLQNPHPDDAQDTERAMSLDQASEFAREQGVKVYIINIEPRIAEPRFAPELRQMRRAALTTGGQFYFVNQEHSLEDIFKEIDNLQKSQLGSVTASQHVTQEISLAYVWIGIGWVLISLSLLLRATYLRPFP